MTFIKDITVSIFLLPYSNIRHIHSEHNTWDTEQRENCLIRHVQPFNCIWMSFQRKQKDAFYLQSLSPAVKHGAICDSVSSICVEIMWCGDCAAWLHKNHWICTLWCKKVFSYGVPIFRDNNVTIHSYTHKFSDFRVKFRVNQLEVFEKAECEVSFLLLCPSKTSLLKHGTISSETWVSVQHNRNEKKKVVVKTTKKNKCKQK